MKFKKVSKFFPNIWSGRRKKLEKWFVTFLNLIQDTPLKRDTASQKIKKIFAQVIIVHRIYWYIYVIKSILNNSSICLS